MAIGRQRTRTCRSLLLRPRCRPRLLTLANVARFPAGRRWPARRHYVGRRLASDALRALNLQWKPVAISFVGTPPAQLPRVDHSLPAGCAYWKYASEGHAF